MDARITSADLIAGDEVALAHALPPDRLVNAALDDSWSTLPAEADLIDRWFGTEIAQLFGE